MNIKRKFQLLVGGSVYVQAPLKAFELDERILHDKYGLQVRAIDYENGNDLDEWCSIIHDSYDDCHFTRETAHKFLTEHSFLTDTETFIFYDTHNVSCATVSIGKSKVNPSIGGDFRIGVRSSHQNRGYGKLCISYAFSKLSAKGVKHGESAIAIKRKESLYLHYALGFRPQYNANYIVSSSAPPFIKT